MATSQLGNHCKSKREGDIKGINDEERKGGWREMRREVKTKRERRGGGGEKRTDERVSFFFLPVAIHTAIV